PILPPPRPPTSTLFPYTTLFRSRSGKEGPRRLHAPALNRAPNRDDATHDATSIRNATLDTNPWTETTRSRRSEWSPLLQACPKPDRKSTRLNSSHVKISYAVFCL